MPCELRVSAGGEGNRLVFQRDVDQVGEQCPAVRPLDAEHTVIVAGIPESRLETRLFQLAGDPPPIVCGGRATGGHVEFVLGQLGDRQVSLNASPLVAQSRVGHRPDLPAAVHPSSAEPVRSLHGLRALQEEFAEVGLIEHGDAGACGQAFLLHQVDVLPPTEGALRLDQLVVHMLVMFRSDGPLKATDLVLVRCIKVVVLALGVNTGGEPTRSLESLAALIHTALFQQRLIQCRLPNHAACQRLVVREDYGVGLGIGLVRSVLDPTRVARAVRMKACHIHGKEVDVGCTLRDPSRDFSADTTAEHHTHGIEATTMHEAAQFHIWPDEWLVVRCERLGATNCALDAHILDQWAPLNVTLQVLVEGVPIQVEKPEVKAGVDLRPELWVLLVAAKC
mmetsp:Transcript_132313/g.423300  ORF Transcript_132313/g.423300 Transcript_132313/m.423300 type:complete len:394 (-) Transcript_132313:971-2152(-)